MTWARKLQKPSPSSTVWPNPMLHNPASDRAAMPVAADDSQAHRELVLASEALLSELESSLHASQQALLARDLTAIEQQTREQQRLQRGLAALWSSSVAAPIGPPPGASGARFAPEFSPQLRPAQMRILHLARVQSGLLRRAQQTLAILANFAAGPEACYHVAANASQR